MDYNDYRKAHKEVKKQVLVDFKEKYELIVGFFHSLNFLIPRYLVRFSLGIGDCRHQDILLSTIFKSLNTLQTITELTLTGEVGSARILMRNVLEFLVIGKHVLLQHDTLVIKKWENYEYINIDKLIFKATSSPRGKCKEAFVEFWKCLCDFNHATRFSGQITYDYDQLKDEIALNFVFLHILMLMLLHFVDSFLSTPYFSQYMLTLAKQNNSKLYRHIRTCQNHLKNTYKIINDTLSKNSGYILKFYTAKWVSLLNGSQTTSPAPSANRERKYEHPTYLTNKEEVLSYLEDYIQLYQTDPQNKIHPALAKYLEKLRIAVKKTDLRKYKSTSYTFFYDIEITCENIKLMLVKAKTRDMEPPQNEITLENILEVCRVPGRFCTVSEYAALHNVSIATVKRWINTCKLHVTKEIDDQTYISELEPRPSAKDYFVQYSWKENLPAPVIETFPYLKDIDRLLITYSGKQIYQASSRHHNFQLTDRERIQLEHLLLQRATCDTILLILSP